MLGYKIAVLFVPFFSLPAEVPGQCNVGINAVSLVLYFVIHYQITISGVTCWTGNLDVVTGDYAIRYPAAT